MFTVEVRDHVMVAHSFRGAVFGPAQALHGATFVIDAAFTAERLDQNGIVVDIGRAHTVLKSILAPPALDPPPPPRRRACTLGRSRPRLPTRAGGCVS